MKTHTKLTPEVIQQINDGKRRVSNLVLTLGAWHDKLAGLGVDVDGHVFADVLRSLIALEADLMTLVMISDAKPAMPVNMGWQCVPGVH